MWERLLADQSSIANIRACLSITRFARCVLSLRTNQAGPEIVRTRNRLTNFRIVNQLKATPFVVIGASVGTSDLKLRGASA
jgi:hypothetical protein